MSDLISRKAVYEMLHGLGGCDATDEWADGWDKGINQAISDLNDIPTAYDVDKVVEELKKRVNLQDRVALSTPDYAERYCYIKTADAYRQAILIVKGAVKDE